MLKTFFFSVILSITLLGNIMNSYAQINPGKGPFIYGEIGVGIGNFEFGEIIALNIIFGHNNIITLGACGNLRNPVGMPSDYTYTSNNGFRLFNPRPNDYPVQYMIARGLMYGKVLYTGSPNVRFILKGGLTYVKEQSYINFKYSGGNPNYTCTKEDKSVIGFVVNPTLELPLSRHFGFNISLYGNINSAASVFSINGGMIFGKLRNGKQYSF